MGGTSGKEIENFPILDSMGSTKSVTLKAFSLFSAQGKAWKNVHPKTKRWRWRANYIVMTLAINVVSYT